MCTAVVMVRYAYDPSRTHATRRMVRSVHLALMLLAFTTRRMVRSARLALSHIRFTEQFDFAVSDRYSYEKMHTASLVRRADLSSRHHIMPSYEKIHTASPCMARWADLRTSYHIKHSPKGSGLMWLVTYAKISPSRLSNDAVYI